MSSAVLYSTLDALKEEKIILYPTDTVWGIGCDATSEKAVQKVFKIKNRSNSKSLIVLVDSVEMLQKYVEDIPNSIFDLLKIKTKPTTIIYNNPKGLAKNSIANDNTVAIRIVNDKFCNQLIHQFGKPIISTSANKSGDITPNSFNEISSSILENVDYAVNLHRGKICNKPSSILKINKNGSITTIRE